MLTPASFILLLSTPKRMKARLVLVHSAFRSLHVLRMPLLLQKSRRSTQTVNGSPAKRSDRPSRAFPLPSRMTSMLTCPTQIQTPKRPMKTLSCSPLTRILRKLSLFPLYRLSAHSLNQSQLSFSLRIPSGYLVKPLDPFSNSSFVHLAVELVGL